MGSTLSFDSNGQQVYPDASPKETLLLRKVSELTGSLRGVERERDEVRSTLDQHEKNAAAMCSDLDLGDARSLEVRLSLFYGEILSLRERLNTSHRQNEEMREALEFYADPETYLAIAFIPDPPCGLLMEDFSDCGDYWGWRPGLRARTALHNAMEDTGECRGETQEVSPQSGCGEE